MHCRTIRRLVGLKWFVHRANQPLKFGYFAAETDAQIFYEEMVYMIINQSAAPNTSSLAIWIFTLNPSLSDKDMKAVILESLKNVVEARGGTEQVSEESGINSKMLYQILSGKGNPSLTNLIKLSQMLCF